MSFVLERERKMGRVRRREGGRQRERKEEGKGGEEGPRNMTVGGC